MSRGGVLKGTYNLIMEVNMHKQKTIKGQKRKRDAELELSLGFPKWLPALAFQNGARYLEILRKAIAGGTRMEQRERPPFWFTLSMCFAKFLSSAWVWLKH